MGEGRKSTRELPSYVKGRAREAFLAKGLSMAQVSEKCRFSSDTKVPTFFKARGTRIEPYKNLARYYDVTLDDLIVLIKSGEIANLISKSIETTSQQRFADDAGVSYSFAGELRDGKTYSTNLDDAVLIANALEITVHALFGLEEIQHAS